MTIIGSSVKAWRPRLAALMAGISLVLGAAAAEQTYYDRFTEALTNGQNGFMTGDDLVNTNNYGPTLTNTPISFKRFTDGELAGIRLGMTMSEVVSVWGKPSHFFDHCGIGPRFWYALPHNTFGDVSLSFVGDRLVRIAISGKTARQITFDNGLSGQNTSADFERLLGAPALRDTEDLDLFNGQIAYRSGPFRMSFTFGPAAKSNAREHLRWASICLEAEAKKARRGGQKGAVDGSQPYNSETNLISSPAAPRP